MLINESSEDINNVSSLTLDGTLRLKESSKNSLDKLGYDNLAYIYVLSHLPDYKDEKMIQKIDDLLGQMKDSVSARFAFAYTLATRGWDTYSTWRRDSEQDEEARQTLERIIITGLEEGFNAQPENKVFQQGIFFVAQRIPDDTFLSDDKKEVLEKLVGEKLDIENNEFAKAAVDDFCKKLGQL